MPFAKQACVSSKCNQGFPLKNERCEFKQSLVHLVNGLFENKIQGWVRSRLYRVHLSSWAWLALHGTKTRQAFFTAYREHVNNVSFSRHFLSQLPVAQKLVASWQAGGKAICWCDRESSTTFFQTHIREDTEKYLEIAETKLQGTLTETWQMQGQWVQTFACVFSPQRSSVFVLSPILLKTISCLKCNVQQKNKYNAQDLTSVE